MPLQRTSDPARYNASNESIYFFMADGEKRVTCSITEQALVQLHEEMERSAHGRLAVFHQHRALIETIATQHYDQSKFEPDGRSIVIRASEITLARIGRLPATAIS